MFFAEKPRQFEVERTEDSIDATYFKMSLEMVGDHMQTLLDGLSLLIHTITQPILALIP
jgi:hypothetical protein